MRVAFGEYQLDTKTRTLQREGRRIPIQSKAFDLLAYLIERRDQVVSSDDLLDALWPGLHVTPAALSTAVQKARQAVGDDGEHQTVLQTEHGKGFRFVAEVTDLSTPETAGPGAAGAAQMPLIAELKRRNVFRVGVAYAIVAWLLIEVASVLLPTFEAPDWVMKAFSSLVILGFPLTLVIAWAFELTPEGIKREADVDRAESITRHTGRKLDFIIIGVLAVAAFIAILLLRSFTFAPVLAQAAEVAEQGVMAARVGNALDAKHKLQTAAGMLYRSGQLDGLEDAEALPVAMQQLEEALSEDVDLLALFRAVVEDARRAAPPAASAESTCRLDAVASDQLAGCLRSRIDEALVGFRQEPSAAPDDLHRLVGAILVKEHELIRRSLERGSYLVPMLREQLEAENMPPLLHYVALIESGYRASAVSHTGATGLWQFIPETARRYGLTVTEERDDRYDPADATRAAAHYLRDLALEFGGDSLFLAVASYNFGENGVRRALRQLDDPFNDRNYWELVRRDLLPAETAALVPRLLAATVAGEAGLPKLGALQAAGY